MNHRAGALLFGASATLAVGSAGAIVAGAGNPWVTGALWLLALAGCLAGWLIMSATAEVGA